MVFDVGINEGSFGADVSVEAGLSAAPTVHKAAHTAGEEEDLWQDIFAITSDLPLKSNGAAWQLLNAWRLLKSHAKNALWYNETLGRGFGATLALCGGSTPCPCRLTGHLCAKRRNSTDAMEQEMDANNIVVSE